MNKAGFFVFLLCLITFYSSAQVQVDSLQKSTSANHQAGFKRLDSIALLIRNQRIDSLKRVADSLAFLYIKTPDPNRPHQFRDSLMRLYQVYNLDFQSWADKFIKKGKYYADSGKIRNSSDRWVVVVVFLLIFGFALLNFRFNKEIKAILSAFLDQRFLNQTANAAGFNSWPYILFFILFGLTIGMYLFLVSKYLQLSYFVNGIRLFLLLSIAIMAAIALKLFVLRLLGLLLQISKMVKPYISFLLLSYFQAAIIFLPLTLAFSLSSMQYKPAYIYLGIGIVVLILAYQLIRLTFYLMSQYQFPKLYLIIYLCALEICPILILVKALRF